MDTQASPADPQGAVVIRGIYIDTKPLNGRNQSVAVALVAQSLKDPTSLDSRILITPELLSDNLSDARVSGRVEKAAYSTVNAMLRQGQDGERIEDFEPKLPHAVLGEPRTLSGPLSAWVDGLAYDEFRQWVNVHLAPVALTSRTQGNRIRGSASNLPGVPVEPESDSDAPAMLHGAGVEEAAHGG